MTGEWLPPARPGTALSLFCLPQAGGSAADFDRWQSHYPDAVDVRPVRLPGRRERLGEPAITDPAGIAGPVAAAIASEVDRPFVLFGHSMGGMLAALLAETVRPALLVVSGVAAHQHASDEIACRVREADDDRVLATIPQDAELTDPELRALVATMLRADLEVCARYEAPRVPLPVPVLALAGQHDEIAPPDAVAGWRDHAAGWFQSRVLPGGHDFPYRQAASVAALITRNRAVSALLG
jgi:surfactin synthase thioesterase subunit